MPRRRSRQSKWQRDPHTVNWRGQRPEFNPSEVPISKFTITESQISYWKGIREQRLMIVDPNSKRIDKPDLIPLFSRCPPHIAVIVQTRDLIFQQSEEYLKQVLEDKIRRSYEGESEE